MRSLRSREIGARADRCGVGGGNEIGGGEETEDRDLLRYLVGFERRLQHLQQEGPQRLPLSMADLDALSRRWFADDADLLGCWDRRDSQNRFRFLENSLSGKWVGGFGEKIGGKKVENLG